MDYFLHVLVLVSLYSMLATSLNLISGFTGLVSVAHAGFYGVGAYTAAILALRVGWPFPFAVLCALLAGCLVGILLGIPSLRIRDDYFVIVTFAFQMIVFSVLNNWVSLTGGPMGLPGIPEPVVGSWRVSSQARFLFMVACFGGVALAVVYRIVRSPFGRVLRAIREDELLANVAGKNAAAFKLIVFTVGAAIAAVAGALYAYYLSFLGPTSFTMSESILILSIVIVGGAGSLWGPVLGSALLVVLPEALRFLGLPSSVAANVRELVYGLLLVAFMVWRPRGLVGEYSFRRRGTGD